MSDEFWQFVENQIGCRVPKYLKNILKLRGFENAASIKTITSADYRDFENFARTKMHKYISPDSKLKDYYHMYSKEPAMFEILPGHVRILNLAVEYIKVMTTSHGQKFADPNSNIGKSEVSNRVRQDFGVFVPSLDNIEIPVKKIVSLDRHQPLHQPMQQHKSQSDPTSADLLNEKKHIFYNVKQWMQNHAHGLFEQISDYSSLINIRVQKGMESCELLYVATMKCPWCEISFEAIKNVSPNGGKDTCEGIFSQQLCTNNWTNSSFVAHVKRCYHSADHEGISKLFLLNNLVAAAKQNFGRKKPGFRHVEIMKMFAAYIKMLGGTLTYDTLHANLLFSLPSSSNVDKYLSEKGPNIIEGVLREKDLKEYLSNRELPSKVWISEDATRVVPRICYDSNTNQLVGFNLPLNEHGMPVTNTYMARTASEIERHFLNDGNSISSSVYTIMANPLSEKAPPFCLTLFGTNNKFTFKDVLHRWSFMKKKLGGEGVSVYGNSSDGDSKCLKAMKIASRLGQASEDFNCEYYSSGPISIFKSNNQTESFLCSVYTSIYVQDTNHVATKFRNILLKPSKVYPIGKTVISNGHLRYLIQNVQKDKHLLNYTDIQPKDRQNVPSAEKICRPDTQNCLKQFVPGSEGTAMYFKIMHYATTPFTDPRMTVNERIKRMWYAIFALRIWRSWLMQTEGTTLKSNFISTNLYTCVELNAHSLIKYIIKLRENNETQLFLPSILSSQPCESTFRQLRSMSSTFSTVVTMPIYEMLFRIKKLQLLNDIVLACSPLVTFPRIENRPLRALIPSQLPTDDIIIKEITETRKEAMEDMTRLGIDAAKTDTKCQIQSVFEDDAEEENSDDEELDGSDKYSENECDPDFDPDNEVIPDDLPQNPHELRSMANDVTIKDYSTKFPEISEKSKYVTVGTGGKVIVIRKSSLCWLLSTYKTTSSSDRLQRVKEDEWKNKPVNCYLRNFNKSEITHSNSCLEKEVVHIGEWCLFSLQGRWLLGLVLSFNYLNQKTYKAQEYPYSSVELNATKAKPVGVLCTLYEWNGSKLKSTTAFTTPTLKNTFIPIESYKATVAAPCFVNDDLLLHELVLVKIDNFKNSSKDSSKNTELTNTPKTAGENTLLDLNRIINVGDFVVVTLLTTKLIEKYFIAQIVEVIPNNPQQYEVKFVKRYLNCYIFPQIPDISLIEEEVIKEILAPPTINRRDQMTFPNLNFKIE